MKKYQLLTIALFFSCFAIPAFAQTKSTEPILHPIAKPTLKAYDDANKDFETVKPSSSDPTKAKAPEKPEKSKEATPVKPEKEKKEKPAAAKTRKAGVPQ